MLVRKAAKDGVIGSKAANHIFVFGIRLIDSRESRQVRKFELGLVSFAIS